MTEQTERLAEIRARAGRDISGLRHIAQHDGDPAARVDSDAASRTMAYLLALLVAQDATIQRVRDLHVEHPETWSNQCVGCLENCGYCEGDHPWPCPTIEALDGQVTS